MQRNKKVIVHSQEIKGIGNCPRGRPGIGLTRQRL